MVALSPLQRISQAFAASQGGFAPSPFLGPLSGQVQPATGAGAPSVRPTVGGGGFGSFLEGNADLLVSLGGALMANAENPVAAPLSQLAPAVLAGTASDRVRKKEKTRENMTRRYLMDKKGLTSDEADLALSDRDMLNDMLRERTPDYGYQEVGGNLVRFDKRTGEAEPIYQSPTAGYGDVPSGYMAGENGALVPRPGGPADPSVVSTLAQARGEGRPPRPLPSAAVNSMTEAGAALEDFNRLGGTFKDGYGGYTFDVGGDIANWAGRNMPGATQDRQDQAQWWSDYQGRKNLTRNALFGSALTATEKGEFDKANIAPGMSPETIRANLARQQDASLRAARKLAGAYAAQGYPREAIEAAIGFSMDDLGVSALGSQPGGAAAAGNSPGGTTSSGVSWSVR